MLMQPWLRLTLITMTVGGGFAGFVGTLQSLFNSPGVSTFKLVLILIFMGLYVFVTVCGLLYVNDPGRTGPLVAALALQIPWISSPLIVYKFAAGAEVRRTGCASGSTSLRWQFCFCYCRHCGLLTVSPRHSGRLRLKYAW